MGKPIGSALEMKQIVTPGTSPPSNNLLLYAKADGKVYAKDSTGVETMVGPGPKVTVGTVAPSSPAVNDVWIDTT
jgi:hypothetical protein